MFDVPAPSPAPAFISADLRLRADDVDFIAQEIEVGEGCDGNDGAFALTDFGREFVGVARFASGESLANGGFVRDDAELRRAVPCSENVVNFGAAVC